MPLKLPPPQSNNQHFALPKRPLRARQRYVGQPLVPTASAAAFSALKVPIWRLLGHCRSLGLFGNEGCLPLAARAGLNAPLRLDSPRVAPLDGTLPWRALPSRWP